MKKIIIALLILISLISVSDVVGKTAFFKWITTEIKVPFGASLEGYKDKYEVEFYVDGKRSYDFEIIKETNCSTFSTVLTNRLGKYTVYYQAYSKTYNVRSEQAIVFNVCDEISPTVEIDQLIYHDYGSNFDILKHIKCQDNTTTVNELIIEEDLQEVNFLQLGTYSASVIVSDLSGRETKKDFMIKIIDNVKPNIKQLKALNVNYGEVIDVSEFFLATDNYDGDITEFIEISGFDEKKIGYQRIEVSVSDGSGNLTTSLFTVLVVDNMFPEITLSTYEVILRVEDFALYNEEYFKKYILNTDDNFEVTNVDIDISELIEAVGNYFVYYQVEDRNENFTTASLKVRLLEDSGPTISETETLRFAKGTYIDYLSLVRVNDPYDLYAPKRLEIIQNNIDINKAGNYQITYRCYNSSGKYTVKTFDVVIYEEEPLKFPIILTVSILCVGVVITGIWYGRYKAKKRKNRYQED